MKFTKVKTDEKTIGFILLYIGFLCFLYGLLDFTSLYEIQKSMIILLAGRILVEYGQSKITLK